MFSANDSAVTASGNRFSIDPASSPPSAFAIAASSSSDIASPLVLSISIRLVRDTASPSPSRMISKASRTSSKPTSRGGRRLT